MNLFDQLYGAISPAIHQSAANIRLVICDIDGVFSDGRIYLGNSGEEFKAFHTRDGFGVKALLNANIPVAVITGRNSKIVESRMTALGVQHIYQGCEDKSTAFNELKTTYNIEDNEIAYIGDDMPDLPLIKKVGLGVAVKDAHPLVCHHANFITFNSGGFGAVRELSDLILINQDKFSDYAGASV